VREERSDWGDIYFEKKRVWYTGPRDIPNINAL